MNSPPSSAKAKIEWRYTSAPLLYAYIAWTRITLQLPFKNCNFLTCFCIYSHIYHELVFF